MIYLSITWLLSALAILGVVLNIYKKRSCFYIWAITNASWTVVDFIEGIYAQSALFFVYFCLALWGIYQWRR